MLKEKCVVNSSNFKLTVCILITVDNKRKKTFFSQKNLLIGMNQNKRYGRTIKITKIFCLLFKYNFQDNTILFHHLDSHDMYQSSLRLHNENICLRQCAMSFYICFVYFYVHSPYFPSSPCTSSLPIPFLFPILPVFSLSKRLHPFLTSLNMLSFS